MIGRTAEKNFIDHLRLEQILNSVLKYCKTNKYSFAAWREPLSEEIKLMIDFSSGSPLDQVELEKLSSGFILSPFNVSNKKLFLNNDLLITWNKGYELKINNTEKGEHLLRHLSSIKETPSKYSSLNITMDSDSHIHYVNLVKKSLSAIYNSSFSYLIFQ